MAASTEAQILISRFPDADDSPERLLRVRLRHGADKEVVLRFREKGLDYEYLIDGGAASSYPLILRIQKLFGAEAFGPKELADSTGVSRATAHRQIELLLRAGILSKRGYGEYLINPASRRDT